MVNWLANERLFLKAINYTSNDRNANDRTKRDDNKKKVALSDLLSFLSSFHEYPWGAINRRRSTKLSSRIEESVTVRVQPFFLLGIRGDNIWAILVQGQRTPANSRFGDFLRFLAQTWGHVSLLKNKLDLYTSNQHQTHFTFSFQHSSVDCRVYRSFVKVIRMSFAILICSDQTQCPQRCTQKTPIQGFITMLAQFGVQIGIVLNIFAFQCSMFGSDCHKNSLPLPWRTNHGHTSENWDSG